ncbi:MAG: T9SS type A sorting domain-containing protein [Flammeovirgaceae bacterium]|nr:T9SS type A sorting domain-containing protein [Flammeovirgaceae bacterium]
MKYLLLTIILFYWVHSSVSAQRSELVNADQILVLKNEEIVLPEIFALETIESSLIFEKCRPSDLIESAVTKQVTAIYHYIIPFENQAIVKNTLKEGNNAIYDMVKIVPNAAGTYIFHEGYELKTKNACGVEKETIELIVIGSFKIEVIDFSLTEAKVNACDIETSILNLEDYHLSINNPGIKVNYEGENLINGQNLNLEALPNGLKEYEITASGFFNGNKTLKFLIEKTKIENVSAGESQEVCKGGSLSLNGESPIGGTWSSNDLVIKGNQVETGEIQPGTYVVTYTFKEGNCEGENEKQITVLPLPLVNAGSDITWCGDGQIKLTGQSPLGGNWASQSNQLIINGNLLLTGEIEFEGNLSESFELVYSYENEKGCVSTDIRNLVILDEPEVPELSYTKVCKQGQSTLIIENYNPKYLYDWYVNSQKLVGENGKSFTTGVIKEDQKIQVIASNPLSADCQQTGSKTVEITPQPNLPSAKNLVICESAKVTMNATHPGAVTHFNWYDQQGNLLNDDAGLDDTYTTTTAVTQDVSYFVTAVVGGLCESEKKEVKIYKINQPGKPEVKGEERCGPGELNYVITSNAGDLFNWYLQESGGEPEFEGKSIAPFLTKTETYYVAAVNQRTIPGEGVFNCEGERTKVTGVVNGIPSPPELIDYTTCGVELVILTGKGGIGNQYNWYNGNEQKVGEGSTFKVGQVSRDEKFYYTTISAEGCESEPSMVSIKYQNPPGLPTINELEICGEGTIEISPEGAENAIFRFYTDQDRTNHIHEGTSYYPQISGQTTFYVSQLVANCEGGQQRVEINYYPKPTPPIVEDVAYCGESDIDLIATGSGIGGKYKWYASEEATESMAEGNHLSIENMTGTISFYVTYTSINGCESQRTKATAYVHQIPEAPKVADEYSCSGSSNVVLYIQNSLPGYEYHWYSDKEELLKTGLTFQPSSITKTTTYKIKAISERNCESGFTSARAVILEDEPVEIGEALTLCKWGESYNLNQNISQRLKGGIFTGSGVFNDSLFIPSAVDEGAYEVQYTLKKGSCKAFGSRKITVTAGTGENNLQLNNGILQICENANPISLDPYVFENNINTSHWSGVGVTSNVFDPSGLSAGIYELDYSVEVDGCQYQAKQKVEIIKTYASKPRVSETFIEVCENEIVGLSVSFSDVNKNIHWYNDENEKIGEGTQFTYQAKASELIYCKGVDQKGCESAPTIINLNVYTFPDSIESSAKAVMVHEAISFDVFESAENQHTYRWNFGDGQSSTQKSPAIFYYEAGAFEVELIISNLKKGCYDTLNQMIKVNGDTTTITGINSNTTLSNKQSQINIFPNPFENKLNIASTDKALFQNQANPPDVAMFDLLGRQAIKKEDIQITKDGIEINTKDIPTGIYLVKINSSLFKLSKS